MELSDLLHTVCRVLQPRLDSHERIWWQTWASLCTHHLKFSNSSSILQRSTRDINQHFLKTESKSCSSNTRSMQIQQDLLLAKRKCFSNIQTIKKITIITEIVKNLHISWSIQYTVRMLCWIWLMIINRVINMTFRYCEWATRCLWECTWC